MSHFGLIYIFRENSKGMVELTLNCCDRGDKDYVFDSVNAVKEILSYRKSPPFNNFVNFHISKLINKQ